MLAPNNLCLRDLIDKPKENRDIHVHKPVQRAVIHRMSPKERQEVYSILVDILMVNIPDASAVDLVHQAGIWAQSERDPRHIETMLERDPEYISRHH